MTRSLRFLRILKLAPVFLMTIFLTTVCMTPSELHAKRVEELSMPGGGGGDGQRVVPGEGDDDQPTGDGGGGRRSSIAVSDEPIPGSGGSSEPRFTRIGLIKNLIVRGGSFAKRLVGFVP